jgi:hypothetical protein
MPSYSRPRLKKRARNSVAREPTEAELNALIESQLATMPVENCDDKPCRKFIRKCSKGTGYQLRPYLPFVGGKKWVQVNCGWYPTEKQAVAARTALVKELAKIPGEDTPLKLWQAMQPLIEQGIIPSRVLPLWVFRVKRKGQVRFGAKCRVKKVRLESKTFLTPERAFAHLQTILARIMR